MSASAFRMPRLPRQLLIKMACAHHNQREQAKAARLDDLYAEVQTVHPGAHPSVLERVCLNYLHAQAARHCPELESLRGQPAHFDAYARLQQRWLEQVEAQYPWLSEACARQRLL
ncbi:MAG: hypothetical protein IGS03_09830 [Candidatus Sericytochromatia bacterium]|nr:hypothetical protein [Candidatus Sericytochromatia bacterium]